MSEISRQIYGLMTDGEKLKNFYRFTSQNPHLTLRDASQIIVERPNANVCYSFAEWNEKGRRVIKGRKGIPFKDGSGSKLFVFDSADTSGDGLYHRETYPLKRLLDGLFVLNGTEQQVGNDWDKILFGVKTYLQNNDGYGDDEVRNQLVAEGIAYSLYCKTAFPKSGNVKLHTYPYDGKSNARLFEDIRDKTVDMLQEIDDAVYVKRQEVEVIDDTEEEIVSDEPTASARNIIRVSSATHSNYKGYVAIIVNDTDKAVSTGKVYLGKADNYSTGSYDNSDDSLVFLSDNKQIFKLLYDKGWVLTQQEMVDTEYVKKRQLPRQCSNGELFWQIESRNVLRREVQFGRRVHRKTTRIHSVLQQ